MYIISDREQEKSVIADDETGRCYGYITSGAGHRELLEAFMDGLATHVAAYEPHELSELWTGFQEVANQLNESLQEANADAGTAVEPTSVENATATGEGHDGGTAAEPAIVETGAVEDGGPVADPTPVVPTHSDTSTDSGGISQTQSTMPCFNCNGSGTAPVTGGKCAVCDGTGEITAAPTGAASE